MDGPKVFDFTLREVATGISNILGSVNMSKDDIDYYLFHQSNRFIIKQIANQLEINPEKIPLNLENFGNTSGVSIPLLILTQLKNLNQNTNLLLSGYGVGLNWGNALLRNHQINVKKISRIQLC